MRYEPDKELMKTANRKLRRLNERKAKKKKQNISLKQQRKAR